MNFNYENINAYGVWWCKNKTKDDKGAQDLVINSAPDSHIIIKSYTHKYGHIFADIAPLKILDLIKYDFNLMEIITKPKHKVYFDIDAKTETINKESYRTFVLNEINQLFPNAEIAVSGSENDYKYSYHITLNNYMCFDNNDKLRLKNIVKYLKNKIIDIDDKIYTKNRCMKFINQSKPITKEQPLKRIQKIILNDDPKKHLITYFFNENAFKLSDVKFNDDVKEFLHILDQNAPLNVSNLPKIEKKALKINYDAVRKNINIDDVEKLTPLDLLSLAPLNAEFNHNYTFFIMLFCFNNGLTIDNYLSWYKQKTEDQNKHINKVHVWSTLGKYKAVDLKMMRNLLSVYYDDFKKYRELEKFNNLMNINEYKQYFVYNEKIEQSCYNVPEKNIYFNYGMGAGKTTETINFIKKQSNKTFLFISPNITLSRSLYFRLKKDNITIDHYDITYKKKKEKMKESNNLIICINSLHYLKNKTYDYIICDEIETTLNKWFDNKTLNDNHIQSMEAWEIFINLFKSSQKNIYLDAFMTNLSLNFINSVENNLSLKIYRRIEEKSTKKIIKVDDFQKMLKLIMTKLNNNKKLFIFYPYNNGNNQAESMEGLKTMIEEQTNKKGISYNADVDDINIKNLDDVENAWANIDFVITNSKITVGINYESNDFDDIFLFIAGFSSPRDVIQASARCRSIKSNNIYINFLNTFNTNTTFTPKSYLMYKDDIYDALTKDIITEKMAPIKGSFYKFCKIAGYTMNIMDIDEELNELNELNINELLCESNFKLDFSNIKTITDHEAFYIQEKQMTNEQTHEEKQQLKKYFFLKKFINTNNTEMLEYLFNNNYSTFIDAIINERSNIFNITIFDKIKNLNEWAGFFPNDEEIKKIKFDDDILDLIFSENSGWVFNKLSRKSKPHIILKSIYKKIFNKEIIQSKCDKSKNYTFLIKDNTRTIYDYCIKNLKAINTNETQKEKIYIDTSKLDIFINDDEEDDETI